MDDEVLGTEADQIDYSTLGVQEPPAATSTETPGGNPAWAPILDVLPDDAIRSLVKPHLEQWDKGVQERFTKIQQQYEPFKRFQDKDPVALERGLTLKDQIDSDPVGFYNRLQSYLQNAGMLEAVQQQQQQQQIEEQEQLPADPRIEQLARQQEQLLQTLQSQRAAEVQQQMQQQAISEVQSELAAIESKVGTLSEPLRRELLQRAAFMTDQAQQNGQPLPTLEDAWNGLQNLLSSARRSQPAPRVVPSGGGLPAPQQLDLASPEGRKARAAQVLEAMRDQ